MRRNERGDVNGGVGLGRGREGRGGGAMACGRVIDCVELGQSAFFFFSFRCLRNDSLGALGVMECTRGPSERERERPRGRK